MTKEKIKKETLKLLYEEALFNGINVYSSAIKTLFGYELLEIHLLYGKTRFSSGKYQWYYFIRWTNHNNIMVKDEVRNSLEEAVNTIVRWMNEDFFEFELKDIDEITDFVELFEKAKLKPEGD